MEDSKGLNSHDHENYSSDDRCKKKEPHDLATGKEVPWIVGVEIGANDYGEEAIGKGIGVELSLNPVVGSTVLKTMKRKGGLNQPEVVMFDDGAIPTFTLTYFRPMFCWLVLQDMEF